MLLEISPLAILDVSSQSVFDWNETSKLVAGE